MTGFGLRLVFPSESESYFSKFDVLDLCPTEGPLKSLSSVFLSVSSAFFSGMGC